VLCVALAFDCAGTAWPDEAGVPVPTYQTANVEAEEAFIAALTAARAGNGKSVPIVTPRYQADIRTFAIDLQAGKISADGALRAVRAWGSAAYRRPVDAWAIDCGTAGPLQLPESLGKRSSAVVSYAAAHFRPKSLQRDQCAVLVVAIAGSTDESVTFQPPTQ
jgi:hypothetical protein